MKKVFGVSVFCIAFLSVMPLIAQDNGSTNSYYYVNVPIERIYPYSKGYIVDYRTGGTGTWTARAYLPLEWFKVSAQGDGTAPKGDIILTRSGNEWPYMTVYYKDGEFSHVRLYLRRERSHVSWGIVQMGVNLDSEFENVSDLKLEF